ncbi:phosphoglycerate kinase [Lyticum sinuosum]|uniref:Phosphoglycerate kinase n=1 Tax=Lyticum sinuosum TaxID=1332059 RepID=A0AAE4VJX3_9RICK|nr:phosphoglycerate kinase [Lyticum sinuosum]MDZ5761335.1 Phosphoglycerate kinase [Lyticum sinuosum]
MYYLYNQKKIKFIDEISKFINYNSINHPIAFTRVDFNIPIGETNSPLSVARIKQNKETILLLLKLGYIVVLISHFGQPTSINPDYSLKKILKYIENEYQINVNILPYELDKAAKTILINTQNIKKQKSLQFYDFNNSLYLLENIRFYSGEIENNLNFAKKISELSQNEDSIYVNDAFSVSHRHHASICSLPIFFPNKSYGGLALKQELLLLDKYVGHLRNMESKKIQYINKTSILDNKIKDNNNTFNDKFNISVVIIGGKKITTKLPLIKNLSQKLDYIILGGAIANTFSIALGKKIGSSFYEPEMIDFAMEIYLKSKAKIILPQDYIVVENTVVESTTINTTDIIKKDYIHKFSEDNISGEIGDIGEITIKNVISIIKKANILIWCGPLGRYEIPELSNGTDSVANIVAQETSHRALTSIAGGGDTIAALGKYAEKFTYCSTAGGAFMMWIEDELPGLIALQNND